MNIFWIDNIRAICMTIIFYRHAEAYADIPSLFDNLTAMYYVNGFFVVSGYLHFKKYLTKEINISEELKNIFFKMIIPVIFFPAIQIIPKYIFFRHQDISLFNIAAEIFGGTASWFVSALVSAKLLLIILFSLFRKRLLCYAVSTIVLAASAHYLTYIDPTPFPWFYKSGMAATLFMLFGGIIQHYDLASGKKLRFASIISCIILAIWIFTNFPAKAILRSCQINIWGIAVSFASCILLILVAKHTPQNRVLDFIGRNSILFYFFCNSVPATLCTICKLLSIKTDSFLLPATVTIISMGLTSVLTFVINRYAPFLLDLRKLRRQKA